MCLHEQNMDSKEGFVSRAIEKRVRNKRRRDPDMYVDVLLSSTVKRLKYELVNDKCPRKDREFPNNSKTITKQSSSLQTKHGLSEENEVEIAVECLQSTLQELDNKMRITGSTATNSIVDANSLTQKKSSEKNNLCERTFPSENATETSESKAELGELSKVDEDVDFDTLMQSLLEICEPLNDNVEELIKEYSIDQISSSNFDFLNSNDPFLPGMFEVMCS